MVWLMRFATRITELCYMHKYAWLTSWLVFIFLTSCTLCAQHTLDPHASKLTVTGTSNLHPWTVTAQSMTGRIHMQSKGQMKTIDSAQVRLAVFALKSGKTAMDKNMYKALKAESHPFISFNLHSCEIKGDQLLVSGFLTVAGTTKFVTIRTSYEQVQKDIMIKGEIVINMVDYNIKPPSYMGSAFKTGDKVTVSFTFTFNEKNGKT